MNTDFETLKKTLLAQPHATGPDLYSITGRNPEDITLDKEAAGALKNLFFYLSLVFRYPTEDVYSAIENHLPTFSDFFLDYAGASPQLPAIDDLQPEYIRLFVNNQGFVPASPYASCYQGDGLLISDDFYRLRQIMAGSGFMLDESVNELEDHLAVLLEFSSNLLGELIKTESASDQKQTNTVYALLETSYRFISPLLDDFTDKISSYAQYDFYKITGKALKSLFYHADPIYIQLLGLSSHLRNELQG